VNTLLCVHLSDILGVNVVISGASIDAHSLSLLAKHNIFALRNVRQVRNDWHCNSIELIACCDYRMYCILQQLH
jgi:hypothetical protein